MANEEINQKDLAKLESEYNELIKQRRQKLEDLKEKGKDPFEIVKYDRTHSSKDVKENYDELEGKTVKVAGRLMSKRVHGKAGFSDINDRYGKLQMYIKIDDVGEENLKFFKTLDLGDIIGVEGRVFKTKTGEVSIHVNDFTLLSKSLKPLPEKWHGLKDPDLRYRQRYVDLIMNEDVRDTFYKRTKIIRAIRQFLDNRGYLEVETPILSTLASGAAARPFLTHSNALDIDLYLRIATELYLKRLIVGGFEKVYEMNKDFRNEGIDVRHNPEFTMIELYEAYTDYHGMMELMEQLVEHCCMEVYGTTKIVYQGTEIDFKAPWRRVTMVDAVKQYAGVDFAQVGSDEEAREIVKSKLPKVQDELKKKLSDCSKGDILNAAFEAYGEEHLIQPTFVCDYPVEVSPLTKKKKDDPTMTERFECFVYARELANAYSELNDPIDQKERFMQQMKDKELGDDEAYEMDDDFVNALEIGMPPTGGMGIGIDRLIMFLTDAYSIRDVLLFPTMKPLGADKKENKASESNANENCDCVAAEPEKIDFSNVKIEPLFEETVDFETFSKSDFRAVKVKECVAVPKSKKLLQFTLDDGTGTDRTILSGIHAFYEPEELVGKTLIAITNLPPRAMMGIQSCGMLLSAVNNLKDSDNEELHLIMVDNHIPAGAKLY